MTVSCRSSAPAWCAWLACLLPLLLAACAGTAPGTTGTAASRTADGRDLATASDQTDADRRAKLHMELGSAYFARGQSTTALDEVKQVLQAKPDMSEAYNLRGLIYAAIGEAGTAEDSFRRAIALDARNGDARHNFAWFLCQQRRWKDADAQFTETLAVPGYQAASRTLLTQGVCQARAGQMADAERTLSRAYELEPGSPTMAVNLAEVLYRRGEFERARFYVRRVNTKDELVSAQTLWLAARIERKLGEDARVQALGADLHKRFPQSPEVLLFDKGRFDE